MRFHFLMLGLVIILGSCNSIPKGAFIEPENKVYPDYSNPELWAASPFKMDFADKIPGEDRVSNLEDAPVDIFFIHPTTYTNKRGNTHWNAEFNNQKLNSKTDESTILYQASVFNEIGRVFAPRYRQAHIHVFYNKKKEKDHYSKKALDFAYGDVKVAFEYYLENFNRGRPIILAAHSQGTIHATRLLKEYFESSELKERLVVSYLVGMPIRYDSFERISPCKSSTDTGCYTSWRSYRKGYLPKYHEKDSNILVTNPLSWTLDGQMVPKEKNPGSLLYKFENGLIPNLADAQVYEDHLWVTKPKFKGSIFLTFKNYHIGDYNLFYASIKNNAKQRTEKFLEMANK